MISIVHQHGQSSTSLLCLPAPNQALLPHILSPYMLLSAEGLAPVDLLLLMAAQENDAPRVAELIRAGADLNTKVCQLLLHRLRTIPCSMKCLDSILPCQFVAVGGPGSS